MPGTVLVNTLFLVEKFISPYNVILGRPWIHVMAVVTSTYHQIKIDTTDKVVEIFGNISPHFTAIWQL